MYKHLRGGSRLGGILLCVCLEKLGTFLCLSLLVSCAGCFHLVTTGLGLVAQLLGSLLLGLLLMDVLHENTFVLEHVTLGLHVQIVVQMKIDLLLLSVLAEKSSQNAHAVHPDHFLRHTCVGGTMTFTESLMSTFPL